MNTPGQSGVGEMQTATALMLDVANDPHRRPKMEHTCDAREEMRKGTTPIWIGDDLGRLQQPEGKATRIATWNVGGRAGTLKSEEKLRAVLDMMEKMRIHLMCVCDGQATQQEVSQTLHTCGASKSFRVYGYDGKSRKDGTVNKAAVLWLVRSGMAVRVLGCLRSGDKHISALLLAGKGNVRTLVLGIYGVPGATTSAEAGDRQQERLAWASQIANKHRGEKHQLVVLGDLNMVPTKALHSSGSLEHSTIRTFQQFLEEHEPASC